MGVFGLARKSVYRFRQHFGSTSMVANSFNFAMLSHPGRVRKGNEDTCAADADAGAFVVCDGMGGAAAGEIASRLAAGTFLQSLRPAAGDSPRTATPDLRLKAAIEAANEAVYQYSRRSQELHGMGTTLVALLLEPASGAERASLTVAHVGDSRCYLFRKGRLSQITQDHSLVEEQVRIGEITRVEAENHPMRNIITRAVGSQASVEPDIRHLRAEPGDVYLLASDGLNRELADEEIAARLTHAMSQSADGWLDLGAACQTLVDEANDAGGGDNITVLLLQLA